MPRSISRSEDLVGKGHTSVQTVDERRATKLTAEADVAAALAEVQRLEEVRSFQAIRAPFDGTIVARHVERGDKVSGDASQQGGYLLRIARLNELRIEIDIPQSSSLTGGGGARRPAKAIVAQFPPNSCMQTGLCRMRTESLAAPCPRSGKRFSDARDRRPENGPGQPFFLAETGSRHIRSRKSRVFGGHQEISFSAGVRGGPERTAIL